MKAGTWLLRIYNLVQLDCERGPTPQPLMISLKNQKHGLVRVRSTGIVHGGGLNLDDAPAVLAPAVLEHSTKTEDGCYNSCIGAASYIF